MNYFNFRKMGESRAQIQREYRERKKAELGQDYYQKERQRIKKYYVPTSNLSKPQQTKRRQKVREQVKRFHKQKKERPCKEGKHRTVLKLLGN